MLLKWHPTHKVVVFCVWIRRSR